MNESSQKAELAPRDLLFQEVIRLLSEDLPPELSNYTTKFKSGKNWLHVAYKEFPRSVYELRQGRKIDSIGFYIGGGSTYYLPRSEKIIPLIDQISTEYGCKLTGEPAGKNRFGLVLALPKDNRGKIYSYSDLLLRLADDLIKSRELNKSKQLLQKVDKNLKLEEKILHADEEISTEFVLAKVYALEYSSLLVRFIEITYNPLLDIFQTTQRPRVRKTNKLKQRSDHNISFLRLEQLIKEIHLFLEGRMVTRPSDEHLCDWVQYCYSFGLYDEGVMIFNYIDQGALNNDWFYQRTRRYANACRVNSRNK